MVDKNLVLRSVNLPDGSRCVDIFRRPDGSFGFEEFRRDTEDLRGWFPIGRYGGLSFECERAALSEARAKVSWLDEALKASPGS